MEILNYLVMLFWRSYFGDHNWRHNLECSQMSGYWKSIFHYWYQVLIWLRPFFTVWSIVPSMDFHSFIDFSFFFKDLLLMQCSHTSNFFLTIFWSEFWLFTEIFWQNSNLCHMFHGLGQKLTTKHMHVSAHMDAECSH